MDDIRKDPFEEYIKKAEPSRRELGYAWYRIKELLLACSLEK